MQSISIWNIFLPAHSAAKTRSISFVSFIADRQDRISIEEKEHPIKIRQGAKRSVQHFVSKILFVIIMIIII